MQFLALISEREKNRIKKWEVSQSGTDLWKDFILNHKSLICENLENNVMFARNQIWYVKNIIINYNNY